MDRRKWTGIVLGLLSLGFILMPAVSEAFTAKSGNNINIGRTEVTQGTLYIAGSTVTVDGDVNGDVVCGGSSVTINGAVHGDVICAAQTITINGPVDGNVRVVGQTVTLNSTVTRNVSVAAQTFTILPGAKVGQDVSLLAQTVSISGPVARDLYGAMGTMTLNSAVGGSVTVTLNDLNLGAEAAIAGDLSYTSDQSMAINKSKVTGTVTYHAAATHQRPASPAFNPAAWLATWLYFAAAMVLIGLVLAWLASKPLRRVTATMLERPLPSIGLGLILLFIAPFVLVILMLTFIGIPLALFLGALWFILVCLTSTLSGVAVGRWLLKRFDWHAESLPWAALIGIPLTFILMGIPFLGFFVWLVAAWWALGAMAFNLEALRD